MSPKIFANDCITAPYYKGNDLPFNMVWLSTIKVYFWDMDNEIKRFQDILELKRYSYNTIKSYTSIIKQLKYFHKAYLLQDIADNQLFTYTIFALMF